MGRSSECGKSVAFGREPFINPPHLCQIPTVRENGVVPSPFVTPGGVTGSYESQSGRGTTFPGCGNDHLSLFTVDHTLGFRGPSASAGPNPIQTQNDPLGLGGFGPTGTHLSNPQIWPR